MDQPLDLTSQDDDLVEIPAGDLETRGRARKQTSPKKVIIDNQEFDVAEPRVVQKYISAPPPFNQQVTSSTLQDTRKAPGATAVETPPVLAAALAAPALAISTTRCAPPLIGYSFPAPVPALAEGFSNIPLSVDHAYLPPPSLKGRMMSLERAQHYHDTVSINLTHMDNSPLVDGIIALFGAPKGCSKDVYLNAVKAAPPYVPQQYRVARGRVKQLATKFAEIMESMETRGVVWTDIPVHARWVIFMARAARESRYQAYLKNVSLVYPGEMEYWISLLENLLGHPPALRPEVPGGYRNNPEHLVKVRHLLTAIVLNSTAGEEHYAQAVVRRWTVPILFLGEDYERIKHLVAVGWMLDH